MHRVSRHFLGFQPALLKTRGIVEIRIARHFSHLHHSSVVFPFTTQMPYVACWFSGGSVRKIEVYENEGGVTGYTGGCRILVIPAGYVGMFVQHWANESRSKAFSTLLK